MFNDILDSVFAKQPTNRARSINLFKYGRPTGHERREGIFSACLEHFISNLKDSCSYFTQTIKIVWCNTNWMQMPQYVRQEPGHWTRDIYPATVQPIYFKSIKFLHRDQKDWMLADAPFFGTACSASFNYFQICWPHLSLSAQIWYGPYHASSLKFFFCKFCPRRDLNRQPSDGKPNNRRTTRARNEQKHLFYME